MKAAIFVANDEPLVIEEVTLDPPAAGQVHVKWGACGVCHSDVSIWNGTLPVPAPCVLGHEGAGVVAEVGEGVTEFAVGDHVIGSFVPTCGQCFYCRNGQAFVCEQSLAIGFSALPFNRPDGSKTMGAVGGLADGNGEAATDLLAGEVRPGDVVITLGAGNVNSICEPLLSRLGADS